MLSNQYPLRAIRLTAVVVAQWLLLVSAGKPADTFTNPVIVVRADPHHQGTVLAGTARALLFRSRDRAETWVPLPFPAELRATLHGLLIDPARPDVYLVAVSSENATYAGVYRSMDEGATWEQLPDLRQRQVWSLAFWTRDPNVIAAGAEDGIFLTRDGGHTWKRMCPPGQAGPQPVVSLAFDPGNSNIVYAGTPHLAWKTSDGGARWQLLDRGMQEDSDIFSIQVDWNRPRRLFAGACSGVYRSLDGGGTWFSLEKAVGAQFRTYIVAQNPRAANTVFAGTSTGLFRSPDGGATWRRLSVQSARSIAFDPGDPRLIFVATDQGVLRSVDGGVHLEPANQGLDSLRLPADSSGVTPPASKRATLHAEPESR
jgi:photosystem II stability/assembly factor-like uncharacterized protein